MKSKISLLALLFFSLWLLAGFVSVDSVPFSEMALATPTPTSAPGEFTLSPLSTGKALSANEVFAQVSSAVAYIETPIGSGSGVLVKEGYMVSNAHVVWPYNKVRVVFPDGSDFENVNVVGWDLVADLALLKLPESKNFDVKPLQFFDGSDLKLGSNVYLIGYPGEVGSYPQPTLIQGILSRVRTWDATGMDVFQVDADVTGRQPPRMANISSW